MSTDGPIKYDADRKLTKAQADINPDPRYWDWFDAWWEEDFSWDGLANKGVGKENAQEYYEKLISSRTQNSSFRDFLIEIEGVKWLCLHAPLHDPQGHQYKDTLKNKLDKTQTLISNLTPPHSLLSAQQYGIIIPRSFSDKFRCEKIIKITDSMFFMHEQTEDFNIDAENSYIYSKQITQTSSSCNIKFTHCSGIINTISGNLDFVAKSCKISGTTRLGIQPNSKITIVNSEFQNLANNSGAIINISERSRIGTASIHGNKSTQFDLTGSTIGELTLSGDFNTIVIKGNRNGNIEFKTLIVKERTQISGRVKKILCNNAEFIGKCDFTALEVTHGDSDFSLCKFHDIVYFSRSRFSGFVNFSNAVFYKPTKFDYATFYKGADFSRSHSVDSTQNVQGFGRIDFSNAEFHHNEEGECVNFSNARFNARTIFDEAMFDGVPDFSGAKLHADTSFQKLQPFKDIEGPKNSNLEIYQRYHNAFRILRQHMEGISDYTAAFMFGRLEQKAKRHMSKGMPWWERILSHAYEAFANYGQSALRPLLWLNIGWAIASVFYALIAHSAGGFRFVITRSIGHSYINSFPPISYAVASFFKSDSLTQHDYEMALKAHPFCTGAVMTLHTLFSAIMVFLILLALRRRFQIR